ncbi:hypothetical protein M9458_049196, partial [Cirrhinus mrigala]
VDCLPNQPRLRYGGVKKKDVLLLTDLCEIKPEVALYSHRACHRAPYSTQCAWYLSGP